LGLLLVIIVLVLDISINAVIKILKHIKVTDIVSIIDKLDVIELIDWGICVIIIGENSVSLIQIIHHFIEEDRDIVIIVNITILNFNIY